MIWIIHFCVSCGGTVIQAGHSVIIGTLIQNWGCMLLLYFYLWHWFQEGNFVYGSCRTRIRVKCIVALIWTNWVAKLFVLHMVNIWEQKVSAFNDFHPFRSGKWIGHILYCTIHVHLTIIFCTITSLSSRDKPPSTSHFLHSFLVTDYSSNWVILISLYI